MPSRYLEDIRVGESWETKPHTVTRDDIGTFAKLTKDHHPLHTVDAAGERAGYGGIIAHGLLSLALMEGLKFDLALFPDTALASLGWDKVRFLKPVKPGDQVRVRATITEARPSKKPDRGVFVEKVELINQRGEVVSDGDHAVLVRRRPA